MRKYITFEDLSKTIRNNFYKIPHDIDFVVGVPRSGMICGSIISEFLNVPLIDCDSFISGVKPSGGRIFEISGKPVLCVKTNKLY